MKSIARHSLAVPINILQNNATTRKNWIYRINKIRSESQSRGGFFCKAENVHIVSLKFHNWMKILLVEKKNFVCMKKKNCLDFHENLHSSRAKQNVAYVYFKWEAILFSYCSAQSIVSVKSSFREPWLWGYFFLCIYNGRQLARTNSLEKGRYADRWGFYFFNLPLLQMVIIEY